MPVKYYSYKYTCWNHHRLCLLHLTPFFWYNPPFISSLLFYTFKPFIFKELLLIISFILWSCIFLHGEKRYHLMRSINLPVPCHTSLKKPRIRRAQHSRFFTIWPKSIFLDSSLILSLMPPQQNVSLSNLWELHI